MIRIFHDIGEFKDEIKKEGVERDIDSVLKLELPFFEKQEKFVMIFLPTYELDSQKIMMMIFRKNVFIFSKNNFDNYEKKYRAPLKTKNGESTTMIFLGLKYALKNYSEQFQKIWDAMNELEVNPIIDKIEESGRILRRLTDRLENLVEMILVIKESEIKEFDAEMASDNSADL